ncbi:DNA-binding transcriptional MerR regulator [Actinomadura hallensis]|uniref:DNA-binding transcriptional MerR regulator n=1 Tax=Actinomadura hallensis TaxID=337895 RepID=A0A543IM98_9ACTN|nr:MerR family transcriptional regulator [Actinomadura hallensis]TQM71705.1 DNA-binding transcriptional MerR regulator [Actinomadura hallensis]
MRIGELAEMVGVSTRTVRHYHHLGLLPEPRRLANGYREYRLKDAVVLARVRRLVELGLSLDEVRDVLADERGGELRDVLVELDADLARQQEAIAERRARLAVLLAEAELRPDSAVSPEMAEILRGLPAESRLAEIDREMLALVDATVEPGRRDEFLSMVASLMDVARDIGVHTRMDALAAADADDPRVAEIAEEIAGRVPDEVAALMVEQGVEGEWLDEMSAAQREVFRLLVRRLEERAC